MGLPILKLKRFALILSIRFSSFGPLFYSAGLFIEADACGQSATASAPAGYVRLVVPSQSMIFTAIPFDPFETSVSGAATTVVSVGQAEKSADRVIFWNAESQSYNSFIGAEIFSGGLKKESIGRIYPGIGFGIYNHQPYARSVYLCGMLIVDSRRTICLAAGYNLIASPFTAGETIAVLDSADSGTGANLNGQPVQRRELDPATAYWCCHKGTNDYAVEMERPYPVPFSTNLHVLPRIANLDAQDDRILLTIKPTAVSGEKLEIYFLPFSSLRRIDFSSGWQVALTNLVAKKGAPLAVAISQSSVTITGENGGAGCLFLVVRGDVDSDGDGLPDAREQYVDRTDPLKKDTDRDGMPDGWEAAHRCDPLKPDAHLDPDTDGFSNAEECERGTDPRDSKSGSVTWYVDGTSGNDAWSGRAKYFNTQDGPVRQINVALRKAAKGDRVEVAGGTYREDVDIASLSVDFVLMGDIDLK